MVNLEFHKPSSWSKGQKMGALGVIFLLIGPFLPYFVTELEFGDRTTTSSYSYFNFEFFGLFIFLPFLCALVFSILLYLKVEIYMQKGANKMNLKPFILMLVGFWFFLTYITEAIQTTRDISYFRVYPGIGIILMIVGYLLCGVAGVLEWRKPSTTVREGLSQKDIVGEEATEVSTRPAVETVAPVVPEASKKEPIVHKQSIKQEPIYPTLLDGSKSYADEYGIQSRLDQPVTKEQKTLLSWAKRLDRHKDIYEKCIRCEKYGFIKVDDRGLSLEFMCPNCNEKFILKK